MYLVLEPSNVTYILYKKYNPAREASRDVANLAERKNLQTPVYGVKEYVCLSVCLFLYLSVSNFDLNYLRTGKILL